MRITRIQQEWTYTDITFVEYPMNEETLLQSSFFECQNLRKARQSPTRLNSPIIDIVISFWRNLVKFCDVDWVKAAHDTAQCRICAITEMYVRIP